MIYKFAKPYEFEGEVFEQIEFNLEALTGAEFAAAKKDFQKSGNYSVMPATDSEFCAVLLSKVCKKPLEFFTQLPVKDYCALTQEVSNFLLG